MQGKVEYAGKDNILSRCALNSLRFRSASGWRCRYADQPDTHLDFM